MFYQHHIKRCEIGEEIPKANIEQHQLVQLLAIFAASLANSMCAHENSSKSQFLAAFINICAYAVLQVFAQTPHEQAISLLLNFWYLR